MQNTQGGKPLPGRWTPGKLVRIFLIAGAAVLGIAGALTLSRNARDSLACKESSTAQLSPGGKYRAQLTQKACGWGMGQASELAELKVYMQDKPGWFIDVPLEYNGYADPSSPAPAPTIKWKSANALEVTVYTNELTGTLVRRVNGLMVTRRYLMAPAAQPPGAKPSGRPHRNKAGKSA